MSDSISFDFSLKTQVVFGAGSRNQIFDKIRTSKYEYIGLIVDHNLVDVPLVKEFINRLEESAKLLRVGYCSVSEPTYLNLDKVRDEFCDERLQAVIGIGGGSALDMAKAMAVLTHNKCPAISYRGFDKMTEQVLPVIAVPTTAGTGSEVTPNASFIDTIEKKKMGINGESVRPRFAFLDPELTLSCPKNPTISAGVDSVVHATEAYVAKKTNPLARFFAREGFIRVMTSLPKLVDSLDDIQLRSEVMYGAFLSGVALMHSGTGPAAAMSYPLGVHYNVPHGIGGGMFLPHVAKLNVNLGFYGYGGLIDGINGDHHREDKVGALAFINHIKDAWAYLDIPQSLNSQNINIDSFIDETLALAGALEQNPSPFGKTQIAEVLRILDAT